MRQYMRLLWLIAMAAMISSSQFVNAFLRSKLLKLATKSCKAQYTPRLMFTTQLNGNDNIFEKSSSIDSQMQNNAKTMNDSEMSLVEQRELLKKLNLHRLATKTPLESTSQRSIKDRKIPMADSNITSGFTSLGLLPRIVDSLKSQGFTDPTAVQKAIIPRILNQESIVMAASTGSGKTFAFMLPVINQLLLQEQYDGYIRKKSRPRCLVLVPTRELAEQVLEVVKNLGHHGAKISCCGIFGGESFSTQKKMLDNMVDIVVASPGRLLKHKLENNVFLHHVSHVIIDEVDTMFTQGFGADIRGILRSVISRPTKTAPPPQMIFATATLTKPVKMLLQELSGVPADIGTSKQQVAVFDVNFPDPENVESRLKKLNGNKDDENSAKVAMKIIHVDGVHRALSNVRYNYLNIADYKSGDKMDILLDSVLNKKNYMTMKTLIFTNTVKSAHALLYRLQASNQFATTAAIPSATEEDSQQYPISSGTKRSLFAYHGELSSDQRKLELDGFRDKNTIGSIMVCTDIAARGLDIPDVDHVILFDFPMNPIDFLHRSGRCGRQGKAGVVTSLLMKRDLVLADAIQSATAQDLPLDSLSSSKRDYQDKGKLAAVMGKLTRAQANIRAASKPTGLRIEKVEKYPKANVRLGRKLGAAGASAVSSKPRRTGKNYEFAGRGIGRELNKAADIAKRRAQMSDPDSPIARQMRKKAIKREFHRSNKNN